MRRFPIRARLMLAAALLLLCAALGVGLASARFSSEKAFTAAVQPGPVSVPELAYFKDANGRMRWDPTPDGRGYSAGFTVYNDSTEDREIELYLLISAGLQNGNNAAVTYSVNTDPTTTTATVYDIRQGSPMYRSFGPGWIYQSYYTDNSLCTWTIEGKDSAASQDTSVSGTVTITFAEGVDPTALMVYLGAAYVS